MNLTIFLDFNCLENNVISMSVDLFSPDFRDLIAEAAQKQRDELVEVWISVRQTEKPTTHDYSNSFSHLNRLAQK